MPDTAIVSGFDSALLVKTILPEYPPVTTGANLRVSEKDWPGGIVRAAGCAANTTLLVVMLEILRVSVPLFEIVITVSLIDPTFTVPKFTMDLLRIKIGNGAWPVPDTVIVSGLEGALLVTKILSEYPPAKAGANLNVSLKDWPGGTVCVPGRAENTLLLDEIPEIFSVSVPLLEIVTTVSLNEVMLTIPKLNVVLLNARIGAIAPPDPQTLTVSGVVNELLVTENLPATYPPVEGKNLRVSTMLCPGAIFALVGWAVNTGRLPMILVILRVSVPVFEIVIVVSLC